MGRRDGETQKLRQVDVTWFDAEQRVIGGGFCIAHGSLTIVFSLFLALNLLLDARLLRTGGVLSGGVRKQRGQAQNPPRVTGLSGRRHAADDDDGTVFGRAGGFVQGVS